jgi:hypothetical protein
MPGTRPSGGNETVLQNIKINSAAEVYKRFGERTGRRGEVPFRAVVTGGVCDCCFPYFTVPEGFYATVSSFGRQMDYTPEDGKPTPIWPAGCYMKKYCCFSAVRELVTKQTVVFDTPVTGVMTKDDILVEIDVCLQLRVMCDTDMQEDPYNILAFTEKLGVVSLMSQLKDAQAETVRMMARKQTHTTVYGLRAMRVDGTLMDIDMAQLNNDDFGREAKEVELTGVIEASGGASAPPLATDMDRQGVEMVNKGMKIDDDQVPLAPAAEKKDDQMSDQDKMTDVMLKKLNKQFNVFGIEICDLQIQDVRLPEMTQKVVETKTTIGTQRTLEVMRQRFSIQVIEYDNEKKLKIQEFGNEGEKIEEKGKRQVAEVNNSLEREKANTQKILRDTQEQSQSKIEQIRAETDKEIASLTAQTKKIQALPFYTPDHATAVICGDAALEGKAIVAENASQLIGDYTRGEVQKNLASGQLKVAEINNETDQKIAQLDAQTATTNELPMYLVDANTAKKCGRPDWAGKEVLADNVARMFYEHAKAEVDAMKAQAELEVNMAQSDSNKAVYAAEGKASVSLRDVRAFELAKQQIKVYKTMVNNEKVSFMGSDEKSMLPNMVTVHNNDDGDAPWDAIKQLTDALTDRISNGTLSNMIAPPPRN